MFGTPLIMMPRQVTRSGKSTGSPSTVNGDVAEGRQVEAGGGDDDVGLDLLARADPDPLLGERLDRVGDDRGLPLPQRREQVAVRDDGDALLPRAVARGEVLLDVEALGQQRRIASMRNVVQLLGRLERRPCEPRRYCAMYWRRRISWVHSSGMSSARSVDGELVGDRRGEEVRRASAAASSRARPSRAIAGISVAAVEPEPMTTTRLPAVVEVLRPRLRVHDQALEPVHALPLAAGRARRGCSSPGTSTGSRW